MTTQMIIRIEDDLKNKMNQFAKLEGKNLSELVRELLIKYTKEKDMGAHIDSLWDNIGRRFIDSGISESDIDVAIKQVRSHNG